MWWRKKKIIQHIMIGIQLVEQKNYTQVVFLRGTKRYNLNVLTHTEIIIIAIE